MFHGENRIGSSTINPRAKALWPFLMVCDSRCLAEMQRIGRSHSRYPANAEAHPFWRCHFSGELPVPIEGHGPGSRGRASPPFVSVALLRTRERNYLPSPFVNSGRQRMRLQHWPITGI
jgi:hypothetical protein